MTVIVVSISGGKDSQATALVCLERYAGHSDVEIRFVFFDTGNEHPITLEHIGYLAQRFNRPIETLRADFSRQIAQKRVYVLTKWAEKGVPQATIDKAAAALVPSGNPFLDLCIWKGRFPSRMAQFCTQELKRRIADAYMLEIIAEGHTVESWQGVRRDESTARKDALAEEMTPEGWKIVRPIVDWDAQRTVDYCLSKGTNLNPLYSMGMHRVGCMPCINVSKAELSEIARRFPAEIDRIRQWESAVSDASKRGLSSFFAAPTEDGRAELQGRNIDEHVDWAMTSRGGKQFDLLKAGPPAECSSIYGLCE